LRLLLASSRPAPPAAELVALVGVGARVGVVANAHDLATRRIRRRVVAEELEFASGIGLKPVEFDLRRFHRRPERLSDALAEIQLLWVTGGNVFVLREAMRRSGLDGVLPDQLRTRALAYVGFSAGACVSGTTLRGLELVEDLPGGSAPNWTGLALTDFALVPHYQSDPRLGAAIDRVVASWEESKTPYRALRDGETILIEAQSSPGSDGGALR
jgi:dipeptidase E